MIQDIAPHKLNNSYREAAPEEDSFVLFFQDGELLVIHDAKDTNRILFPEFGKIKEQAGELTYLFSVDDRLFFRSSEKNMDAQKVRDCLQKAGQKVSCSYEKRNFFRTAAPKEYAFAAITGLHLNGWYEKNQYCGACSGRLVHDKKERMMHCPVCGNMIFPRINPAVIVAVTNGDELLLTKYRGREYKKYALVAGFNEIGENLEQTVAREVMEETGLRVKNIRYYKSQPWGFTDNILAGYFCDLDGDATITMDQDELSVAEWEKREEIDVLPEDLSLTNEMICCFISGNYPQ